MDNITVNVNSSIFTAFRTFRRGIVVAEGVDNSASCPALEQLLTEAIEQAQQFPIDLDSDPSTQLWKQAHRDFGSNPNKFSPSHIAMRKRIQKGCSATSA